MWKTEEFQVGKECGLDAPNENATIRYIPLMWLPGETNKQVVARMQQDEVSVRDYPDDQASKAMEVRMEGIYAVLPHIIARWDLKDPETGEPIPAPKEMFARGDMSVLKSLPTQILLDIINKAMDYGNAEDEPAVGYVDPDANSGAAQVIPFVNATVSEPLSLLERELTNS